ncbi:YDG domain-containing protein [Janthinobacterium psychrotolerans]|uniref:Filamentous hemagglutinin family N-terminal domain-containing protein n=1 Tax=Janthinobacterium psychrotolerans TaxID=1747903 RepID=A0A1A7BT22_9BURK|nr:YDG domain-containing protein [Janthinobacterium psychrotolerans]OBV36686.1 filamentous hemagglutinin family N-terminal domain-containing protein [Janthinobacterium psychrotolerans]
MTKQKQVSTVRAGRPVEPPLRRTALALLIAACFNAAHANPALPQVVHGQATFNQQGNLFTITNTPNTIINWQSFSVNPGEITRFLQQNAGSSVLNRITGQDPSKILGALQSNGKVFLINPNGVLFGRDAKVDVAGLVASSLALSNQDFLAGKMNFNAGDKAGAVINQGSINAGSGGQILLIAPNVENSGIITAPNGDVLLAAGHSVQLADAANPDLRVVLSAPADQAINVGQIVAQGGHIGMLGALLNQRGVLNANSAVVGENGKIVLKATGKTLLENGSMTSATSAASKGGEITVLGDQVGMQGNAAVDASGALGGGTVLLGGDYQGKNPAIANARQVAVGKDATIAADAIQSGDGGKVIVWGNETARVFGTITARGGAASGNGGLVETSGHYLDVKGIRVDTSSRRGKRGNWLLDPYDIDVVAGYGGELDNVNEFTDAPESGSASIGADTISSAGSGVTLQATRRINFNSAINMVSPGAGVTAIAGETINVNADIATSGGAVTLSANDGGGTAYGLGSDLHLGATIITNGGTASLSGASVTGTGTVNAGGGDLTLRANDSSGGISLSGSADGNQLTGGTLRLEADNISYGRGIRGNSVTLTPMTFGRPITLGVVGDKPTDSLGLTNAELFRVVAGTLTIGSSSAGTINQTGSLSISDYVTNLELTSGVGINLNSFFTVLHNLKLNVGGDGGGDNLITSTNPLNVSGEFFLESGNWVQNSASLPSFSAYSFKIGSANFLRATGGDGSTASPYRIADVYGLQGVDKQVNNTNYILAGDIDASGTASWNQGAGFAPLFGGDEAAYSGAFDGANHAINNLTINRGNSSYYGSGLFARIQGATINNLTMQGGSVTGGNNVGAIVGNNSGGYLSNVTSSMAVSGTSNVGGLVGNNDGTIDQAYATGGVGGAANIGGLVGRNGGSISNAYATGAVGASTNSDVTLVHENIGGLIGRSASGSSARYVYSSGAVASEGFSRAGAVVGRVDSGAIVGPAYFNKETAGSQLEPDGSIGRSAVEMQQQAQFGGFNFGEGAVWRIYDGYTTPMLKAFLKPLQVTASGAVSRVYDGQLAAFTGTLAYSGLLDGDSAASGSAGYNAARNVGSYALGGLWSTKYDITLSGATTLSIMPRTLSVAIGGSKVYDGQLGFGNATLTLGNTVAGDTLGVTGTAQFVDKNAGAGKAVNISGLALTGNGLGNYSLAETASGTADIRRATLALGSVSAANKIYDGSTSASLSGSLDGVIGADQVQLTGLSASFTNKNVGVAKDVNYSVTGNNLSGNDAGNYALTATEGNTSAAITARTLNLGFTGVNKTYDGGVAATVTLTDDRIANDVLAATANAVFADKNAAAEKAIAVQGASLSGLDAGNYVLASTTGATSATIAQRALALGFTAGGKTYDGSTAAMVAVTDNRVAGDVLTATATGAFADKNAGVNKAVTVQNASLSGLDAANYVLASTTGATSATIAQRALALGFTAAGKTYDGSTAATVAVTDNRVVGDVLTATATGTFADKNAGVNKAVTVQNASLSGTDAGNYVLSSTTGATSATIAQRALALGFTAAGKTYDGSNAATVGVTDDRVAGDLLTATATGAFADKNAGVNKTVTVQSASLSGTDAGNYVLASTTVTTSATIAQRALALGFTAGGKTYDGSTAAMVAVTDNRVAGDLLTATATGAFADKNAGVNRTVTVQNASLSGTDAGNYVLSSTTGATSATIAQRALALGFTAAGKTYDGSTAASVAVTDNRVVGDVLTATATATFADKNAGANKAVTVQNAGLSGLDAANYVLASTTGATSATIAQRALALGFTAAGKTYDGSTAATVGVTDDRVAGDVLTAAAAGSFADKNAGVNKAVNVQNASLSGTDAGNYVLASTTGATIATIAQRALALGFTAAGKTYDGTTAATVAVTDDRVAGDVLTAAAAGSFADKNAGANKAVTVQNASLSGADAGNYVLSSTTDATSATIAQRALALGFAAAGKTYDGNTTATVAITDNRVVGDVLTATATGTFADKSAGANKAVTVQNAGLSGLDAANYVLASTTGATSATIAQRALALGFTAAGKTYDGSTAATVAVTDNRVVGDVLTATATGTFADKNAGVNKAVTVQNASLSGTDAGNYVLSSTTGATSATIAQRALALGFTAAGKTYDGSTAATVAVTDNRVAGDVLTATATGAFADKNAGVNKAVTVQNASLSGTDAGNYVLASTTGATSATIAQRALALGFTAAGKTYDGSTAATVGVTDDRVAGDVLTAAAAGSFADKNAGDNKAVAVQNASVSGADAANYVLSSTTGATSATIAQRALALGFTAAGKTYDGSTAATVAVTDDRVAGDAITATASGAFADKNAGVNKTVTVQNASLSGTDAGNYVLGSTTGTSSATIAQRALALGFTAGGKTYDGSTAASVAVTDNRIAGDVLTAAATGAFADKNAGVNKSVTVQNASVSGADAANYVLSSTTGATSATIAQRALALGFTAAGKTYDGSNAATVGVTDDRVAGDLLTATATGAFADKNAGVNKTVTVQSASLSGTDAGNYVLASTTVTTSATIAQRALALGFTAGGKTYDGSTAAMVAVTDNRVAGDVLTATATGAFADKNAGVNKTVTVQNAGLSGLDAANYVLASTTGATSATITQRELALAFAAAGKTYDGNTTATVAVTDNRVAGDVLTATATATFADKNAGANKAVTVQNASLSGTDAGNYVLSSTTGATSATSATIVQRALALGFTAAGKTYDGSTAATVAVTDDRVAGDVLTAAAAGSFADKNAGANKAVTVQNAGLSGLDAANYVLASTTGATSATITQRELSLAFAAAGKTYDGNTAATVAVTDNRVAGDVLTATASGAFADKNAGANKVVTVQSAILSGTDAANYTLSSTTGATSATITQRELSLAFAAAGKTYDGNTAASVAVTDNRVAGDVLTATASGAFADKNAGANKVVTVQSASLSGTDAANYTLSSTTGATSATITQRELSLAFAAAGKTYDGNTAASVAVTDNRVAGDVLTATASGAFADKNAGANKVVTVQSAILSGTDAANYTLSSTTGATSATITQRELSLAFAATGKTYDGNTAATVAVTDNRVAGDVLTATAAGTFADKNAAANKVVTVQNASLSGLDAGNYRLATTGGASTASIAQRALSLAYTGVDKVYDGAGGAQVAISDNRIAGDVLSASANAAFADKNAGSGKAVAVQGAALSGADAGNYRLANTAGATTANIARATLTLASVSASDKVYDGTQAASVSGMVAGVIGQDAVSLAGGSGTFADRNFGTGKTVAVGGFQLAGSDAGNYTLASNSGVAQASIAQRALSTWIGASGGLWSDAANWEGGVAPSGSNVLAADFVASTGSVVYTAAAGDTVLNNFTSRGGLNLTGGSLLVNGALSTANYAQSGGLLGGAGNVTVSNGFSQSGGTINVGGNLAIIQASGDLRFAALAANTISLSASAGAISQSGAVVARSLVTQSQNGTVLNDAGNRLKTFSASNSGAGGIALTTTSAPDVLVLGSLATGAGDVRIESTGGVESHAITTTGGNVTLIAHSPVNVQGVVQGNDVTVDASTGVTFGDGARVNAAGTIAVTAGTGVSFAGASTLDVQATGGINVLAKNGDLTAADTVRINSRGAAVSLLAPNGKVALPASVMVTVPVTPPVTPPVAPPALVTSAINTVPAFNEQYSPFNQISTPNNVTSPLVSSTTKKDDTTKETSNEAKNGIQKTYCN